MTLRMTSQYRVMLNTAAIMPNFFHEKHNGQIISDVKQHLCLFLHKDKDIVYSTIFMIRPIN